jgi:hypothetical protein
LKNKGIKNLHFSTIFLTIFHILILQKRRFSFCDCVIINNQNNLVKKATPTIFSEFLGKDAFKFQCGGGTSKR